MAKFDLVIFDCDGVLLDSEIIACQADSEAFTAIGYKISTEEVSKRFAGMPDELIDEIVTSELGKPLPDDFRSNVKDVVLKKYRTELRAMPGAKSLLGTLEVRKCVASSSTPAKLALGLIETGLYELVYPNIFSTQLVAKGKPHPDIFLYAAQQMDTPPERCVVVEDSVAGVTAAKSAGMKCIGFSGGSHCSADHAARLIANGATLVCETLEAVKELIQG